MSLLPRCPSIEGTKIERVWKSKGPGNKAVIFWHFQGTVSYVSRERKVKVLKL